MTIDYGILFYFDSFESCFALHAWPQMLEVLSFIRTLTNPVSAIKCLESIKEYVFFASEYPVIITIEDHLTKDLRDIFAEMATQFFRKVLFKPKTGFLKKFPSPKSLKNRIVISTKPPKESFEENRIKDNENSSPMQNGSDSSEEETWGKDSPDSMQNESDGDNEGDNNSCECDKKSYQ